MLSYTSNRLMYGVYKKVNISDKFLMEKHSYFFSQSPCPSVYLCNRGLSISFFYINNKSILLMTKGCVMIFSQSHLAKFKVTGRKSANLLVLTKKKRRRKKPQNTIQSRWNWLLYGNVFIWILFLKPTFTYWLLLNKVLR